MKNTQIYKYTIPANGAVQILTEGSYFRILSASGPVEVDADTYGNIVVLAGQGVKDQPFKRLFLNDKSGSTNAIELLVSDGSFVDDRITGDVSIIDGEKNKALNNLCFSGLASIGGIASNYSRVQLWNPAGSGKNLILTNISLSTSLAGPFLFFAKTASLANDTSATSINSKKIGINSGFVARTCSEVGLATDPRALGLFGQFSMPAQTQLTLQEKTPYVIAPGLGFTVESQNLSCDLRGNFSWVEDAIL